MFYYDYVIFVNDYNSSKIYSLDLGRVVYTLYCINIYYDLSIHVDNYSNSYVNISVTRNKINIIYRRMLEPLGVSKDTNDTVIETNRVNRENKII